LNIQGFNLVDYKLGDKALSIQKPSLKFSRFSRSSGLRKNKGIIEFHTSQQSILCHPLLLAQRARPVLVHRIPLWKFLSTVVNLGDENGKFLRITLDFDGFCAFPSFFPTNFGSEEIHLASFGY